MNVSPVPPEFVDGVWPQVSELFAPAIKHAGGRFTNEDVLEDIRSGVASLWVAWKEDDIIAAISLKVVDYPRRRFAQYEMVGSKPNTMLSEWQDALFGAVEDYAKNVMNCDGIEGAGRRGWEKMGLVRGYRMRSVFVEKDL